MKNPFVSMARSLWLKMANRAAGKAAAQMRRESAKGLAAVGKPAARKSAKTARKAAQTTRRKAR